MKLSATSLGCPDWSFDKILSEFQRLGFDGIEIRGLEGQMEADQIVYFNAENAETTLQRLAQHNLELVGFGTSCNFHDLKTVDEKIAQAKISIDVCHRMKIPAIRVFGDAFPAEYTKDEVIASVIRGLKELCEYGLPKQIAVYLEIHGAFNTVEVIQPILEALKGYDNFGILWDIEHSDRAYFDNVEPFYQLIRPFIRHVHVKDYVRATETSPFRLCLVGEGEIPIPMLIGWLKRDGYEGYLSLEWEKKWVPELPEAEIAFPAFVSYIKTLL